jgi:hypothetical protein
MHGQNHIKCLLYFVHFRMKDSYGTLLLNTLNLHCFLSVKPQVLLIFEGEIYLKYFSHFNLLSLFSN